MASEVRIRLSIDGSAQVNAELRGAAGALDATATAGDRAAGALARVGHYGAGLLALGGLREVVRSVAGLADEVATLNGRLRTVTDGQEQFAQAQQVVIGIAERQRKGLSEIGTLYASTAAAASELGATQRDMAKFTEGVAASLTLSGTGAQAASGALLQLSQAVGGSVVQAQEFNSLIDGARPLLVAAAKHIDEASGSVNRLKAMVNEGRLSSADFFHAIVQGSAELIASSAKMPPTIGQALTKVRNEWMLLVGAIDAGTGASSAAASVFDLLAGSLGTLATVAGVAAAVGIGRLAQATATATAAMASKLAAMPAALAADRAALAATVRSTEAIAIHTGFVLADARATLAHATGLGASVVAQNAVIAASARHTAALAAQTAAQTALSRATTLGGAAMGLLGGPVGLVVTALGLGVTAWAAWSAASKRSNDEAAADTKRSTESIVADLTRQAEKLEALNRLRNQPGGAEIAKAGGGGAERLSELGDKIAELTNKTGRAAAMNDAVRQAVLQATLKEYASVEAAIRRVVDAEADHGRLSREQQTSEYLKKYATDAERLSAALKQAGIDFGGVIPPEIKERIEKSFTKPVKESVTEAQRFTQSLRDEAEQLREQQIELTAGHEAMMRYRAARLGAAGATDKLIAANEALRKRNEALIEQAKDEARWKEEAAKAAGALTLEELKNADAIAAQVAAAREHNATIGKTAAQLAALEQAKLDDALATAEQNLQDGIRKNVNAETLAAITLQVEGLRKLKELKEEGVVAQASADAARDAADQWQRTADSIYDGLTDSLFRAFENGKGFFQSFWDGIKNTFKTTVLRIAVQYVGTATGLSGFMGSAGAAVQGAGASGGGLSSLASLGSLAGIGGNFGPGFNAGLSGLFGEAGIGGVYSAGTTAIGAGNLAGGLGTLAGGFAGMAGGALAGMGLGRAIGGGYSVGGSGNIATGIGTGIGMVIAGPLGAAIGGSLGGVFNRAFGRKAPETQEAGITGTVAGGEVSAHNYRDWLAKGGWFRSDKRGTDTSALTGEQADVLGLASAAVYAQTQEWARALQLPAESLAKVSYDLRIKLGADEKANTEAINAAFGAYQDKLSAQFKTLLAPFQKAGETLSATFARLAGLETFSASLNTLGGVFSRLAALSVDARENMIELAGGMDALAAQSRSFVENYYSRDELAGLKANEISGALAAVGVTGDVASREEFRALVESRDVSTAKGREQLAVLLQVADSFAGLSDYLAETGKSLNTTAAQAPAFDALGSIFSASAVQQVTAINAVQASVDAVRAAVEKSAAEAAARQAQADASMWWMQPPEVSTGS